MEEEEEQVKGPSYESQEMWKIFRDYLQNSKKVRNEVNKEKRVLGEALLQVGKYVETEDGRIVEGQFEPEFLIRKIIKWIQFAISDISNKNTILSWLQVFIILVKTAENRQKQEELQKMLNKLDAMKLVLVILSEYQKYLDIELLTGFISFGISLLKGGNTAVQTTIYEFCLANPASEYMFQKFDAIIKK